MSRDSLQEVLICLGDPVAGNPAQFMTERALAELGLDWRFLTLEVSAAQLSDAIRGAKAMGFRGIHVAPPHLETALGCIDDASETAKRVGAVNCMSLVDDKLIGENTIGKSVAQLLQNELDITGQNIVLFGAGPTARAIAFEVGPSAAATLTVVNRTLEKAAALAGELAQVSQTKAYALAWPGHYDVPKDVRCVINATSVGSPGPSAKMPINPSSMRPDVVFFDLAGFGTKTRLLREAQDRGCKTLDAQDAFIRQTFLHIQAWTGSSVSEEVLREALEEYLAV